MEVQSGWKLTSAIRSLPVRNGENETVCGDGSHLSMKRDRAMDSSKTGKTPTGEKGNAPPRVLHILMELRPSGAEVMLRIAAPFWFTDANSHSILATGQSEGPYADCLRATGFEVYHIPFSKTAGFFYQVFALIRRGRLRCGSHPYGAGQRILWACRATCGSR